MPQEDDIEIAKKFLASAGLHIQNLAQEDVKRTLYELATAIKHILQKIG